MTITVLGIGTVAYAVGKNRFEIVIEAAANVGTFIHHNASQLLANTLSHKSAFLEMHVEAFFRGNHGHLNLKTARRSCQLLVTREGQVVGVAREGRFEGEGKTVKADIESIGAQVGQRG